MQIEFTDYEIAKYYRERVPKLKQRGPEWRGACPVHHGKDENFAVNPRTGAAFCHSACGRGWDIIGLEQEFTGAPFQEAKAEVFTLTGKMDDFQPQKRRGEFDAAYNYLDESGVLQYQAVRFRNPKGFTQRRPDGKGDWIWNLTGIKRVPYRLPELIPAEFAFIVEGEKDADNLAKLGLVATCNSQGAGKFGDELVPYFAGKCVAILPDNDDPGRKHGADVAAKLHGTAKAIKIIELPNLPEKGDVSDFLAAGGTVEQLRRLYQEAPIWVPETAPHEEDQYIRNLRDEIDAAGSVDGFWDLTKQRGVPTPFERLTRALNGGMLDGEVYGVAARTGNGKTSLGLQFAIRALREKKGVVMFSMEMTWRAVFHRMLAIEARVDLSEFRWLQEHHQDTTGIRMALAKQTSEFYDSPLWVSEKSRVTPEYLLKEVKRLRDRLPKVDMLLLDHLQLCGSDEKNKNSYEKFTAISRALKQVAKELKLPILVMSQVKRPEDKGHTELDLSDLRDSGALEEDMAGVMLIYPDEQDIKQAIIEGRLEKGPVKNWLKLAKNRFGSSGLYMPLVHFKRFTRFDEAEQGGCPA